MKAVRKNQMQMLDIRNAMNQIIKMPFTGLLTKFKKPRKEESINTEIG